MVNYLNRTFPPGTPLEELDIDIIGSVPSGTFKRPVVELWGLRLLERLVVASVASPGATAGAAQHGNANYKHFLEVWIDTLRDEYDREAARSPLERGILFGENRFLDTCFGVGEDDEIGVTSSNSTVSPLFRVPLHVGILDIGGVKSLSSAKNASVRMRALETTTRWNVVERHVTNLLANSKSLGEEPLVASHPKVMTVLLDVWRKLPADDPRNLDFEKAASLLKLSDVQRKQFAAAGAENLSGIATALTVLPDMERQNEQAKRVREVTKKGKGRGAAPELINVPLDAKARAVVLAAIASSLGSR
jgi:hypothetical protein